MSGKVRISYSKTDCISPI